VVAKADLAGGAGDSVQRSEHDAVVADLPV
jgi:hypothetical protein